MGYDSAVFRATTLYKKKLHIESFWTVTNLGQPVINRMPAEAQYMVIYVVLRLLLTYILIIRVY